jgi:hypothetical protein
LINISFRDIFAVYAIQELVHEFPKMDSIAKIAWFKSNKDLKKKYTSMKLESEFYYNTPCLCKIEISDALLMHLKMIDGSAYNDGILLILFYNLIIFNF